jgi:hypothetical protein
MPKYVNVENVVKKRQNECVVDLVQDEVEIKQLWEDIWRFKMDNGFRWIHWVEEIKEEGWLVGWLVVVGRSIALSYYETYKNMRWYRSVRLIENQSIYR